LKTEALALTQDLYLHIKDEKTKNKQGRCDWLQLLAAILAQWRHPVASAKVLELLHRAMCLVLYRRTAAAIKMAIKVGPFFVIVLFAVALAATGAIRSD
jgi:hypothetical protein